MNKLTQDDLLPLSEYEKQRAALRARTVDYKKSRRLKVGPLLSFVFEDRDTLRFQIQEMCRIERIVDPRKVQEELDVYNELLPTGSDLSATMFVELTTEQELREWLPKLPGVEHATSFRVGDAVVKGVAEGDRSKEDATSSVHYIRYPFTPAQIDAWKSGVGTVRLVVDHPGYLASTDVPPDVRASLARDFG